MNQEIFESGYQAYQAGDWSAAASAFAQAKNPGEVSGRIDHLRGNALMQLGNYDEAAAAYGDALADASYGMVGALCTNRGRALVAAGRLPEAIESLQQATDDGGYATPYKAYMALGGAHRAQGDVRSAGIAYRKAAIDEANPNPSVSLRKLGECFMDLGRANDAIESYRTALDFSSDSRSKNSVYSELALAYVAANRMNEAVDAFEHATADGTYTLTPEAQAAYDAARNAVAARAAEHRVSETDDMLASAGYGSYPVDPLDPTGETTGNLMPSPEDTGFFSLSEEELVKDERSRRKGKGGKVLIILLVVLLLLGAAAGFGYYSGFGWPTQESVVQGLFEAKTNHADASKFIAGSLKEEERQQIVSLIPAGATISITGVNRSMHSSEVLATAALAEGGEQSYEIKMSRDGIGWKVTGVEPKYVTPDVAIQPAATSETQNKTEEAKPEGTPAEAAPADETPAENAQPENPEPPAESSAEDEEYEGAEVYEGTYDAEY